MSHPPKYYFNDTGVLNELGIRPRMGHLAENAVFIEFLRRQFSSEKYKLFYEVIDDQEYDFSDGKNIFEVKFKKAFNKFQVLGIFAILNSSDSSETFI